MTKTTTPSALGIAVTTGIVGGPRTIDSRFIKITANHAEGIVENGSTGIAVTTGIVGGPSTNDKRLIKITANHAEGVVDAPVHIRFEDPAGR